MSNNTLPPIDQKPADTGAPPVNTATMEVPIGIDVGSTSGPTSKDIAIGVGVLFVLAVVFIFIRQGFVNWLVSSHKRAPNSAGLAGWGLFGTLFFGSAIGSLALVNKSLFALPYILPLAGLSLVCFGICIFASRKS